MQSKIGILMASMQQLWDLQPLSGSQCLHGSSEKVGFRDLLRFLPLIHSSFVIPKTKLLGSSQCNKGG